jgi:hypothetical protein
MAASSRIDGIVRRSWLVLCVLWTAWAAMSVFPVYRRDVAFRDDLRRAVSLPPNDDEAIRLLAAHGFTRERLPGLAPVIQADLLVTGNLERLDRPLSEASFGHYVIGVAFLSIWPWVIGPAGYLVFRFVLTGSFFRARRPPVQRPGQG